MARPTKNGVSEAMKFGSFFAPSCQFASVTPKWSSMASLRMYPGVTATAATPCLYNSSAIAYANRVTEILTRS